MNYTLIELAKLKETAYEHYIALSHQNMNSTIEGRVSQDLEYRRAMAKWQYLEDQYRKALEEEIKNENL